MKKWIGYLILTGVLAGFPLVSYLYLTKGYNYRLEAIESMGDYGSMPDLSQLERVRGELPDSLRGNMVVVGWLAADETEAANTYGRVLDSLYQQFANSPHLYFTTIAEADMSDSLIDLWLEKFALPQVDPMLSILRAPDDFFQASVEKFKLSESGYTQPGADAVVALVDSSMTIRKHYDLVKREETIDLVQLISLFIPLPEEEDLILERDKEL